MPSDSTQSKKTEPADEPEVFASETHRVRCPEGTVFVIFDRTEEGLHRISVKIGKGDYNTHAHADGIARMATAAFRAGVPIRDLAVELRGISHGESNRLAHEAMSVSDAIAVAMLKYTGDWDEG